MAVPALAVPHMVTAAQNLVSPEGGGSKETAVRAPDPLTSPITVARVQSRYQTGNQVRITYFVNNNLPPTLAPEVALGTSITDTVGILSGVVLTDDVNTLHQVALTSTLTAAATYVASSQPPVQNGNTLSWQLADLPPGGTAVLTMTVQPPAAAADFTNLDTGAVVTAALWDGATTDSARPALVAPDSVAAETLQGTIDADLADEDMLWETAVFDQDPVAAFRLVQEMSYDPYKGSLRGTRGTLWGESGNSLDQSSLLIAMLRAAGIPARYRHGTLPFAEAQTVLGSMFDSRPGVAGYLPAGTPTADPLNDPALLALTQDHWWVEAYLPGSGWTDLEP